MARAHNASTGVDVAWLTWATVMLFPAGLGVLIAVSANSQWDPAANSEPPAFGYTPGLLRLQLSVVLGLAWVAAAVALANLVLAAMSVVNLRREPSSGNLAITLTIPIAASPAFVRASLPWESPYDGTGSPLAVLIGLVFLAALGLPFAAGGVALLMSRVRWRRQGRHPGVAPLLAPLNAVSEPRT